LSALLRPIESHMVFMFYVYKWLEDDHVAGWNMQLHILVIKLTVTVMLIKNCSVIVVTIRVRASQPTDRLSSLTCYLVLLVHLQFEENKYKEGKVHPCTGTETLYRSYGS
jgi:hypothetical protein